MFSDNPVVWLFAAIAAACAFLAVRYWQRGLFGVFVLLVFEGALRKWIFPSAQAQIYLVKDVILLAVYLGFILDSRRNLPAAKNIGLIKIILVVGFVWGCIEVLNPNSPSILVGLMGLKTYFLYVPVAFILPYAIKSREHLFVLIRRYLIMAIPVAVLGFIQIMAGPDSGLNVYVQHSEDAPTLLAYFGQEDFVRTSGTFSYISGYTAFLSFVAFLAIGYNMAHGWRLKNNIAPVFALTLVVGAMFTTGSRAPVYILLATSPVILWLAATSRVVSLQTALRLCILVPVITILALNISPRAFEAFMHRAEEADSSYTLTRLFQWAYETPGALSEAPFLGIGIGTTHPAALNIMGVEFPWWLNDLLSEAEMARVTVELGLIGLLLTYSLRFLIPAFALRCVMCFKDPAYRALGIVLAVHLALGFIASIILNVTAGLYYWGAFGLVLAMQQLEQSRGTEAGTVVAWGAGQTTNLQPVGPEKPAAVILKADNSNKMSVS
jgi:hypothetical protein